MKRFGLFVAIALSACTPPGGVVNPAVFTQGLGSTYFQVTDDPLDLALDGMEPEIPWDNDTRPHIDFFVLRSPSNQTLYTRYGQFKLDAANRLVHEPSGFLLEPAIAVPKDATDIHVRADGLVMVRRPFTEEQEPIGQIQTARFTDPTRLRSLGDYLLAPAAPNEPVSLGRPATRGFNELKQGVLENLH